MMLFRVGAHTLTNKKKIFFYTEAEREETRSVALVGLPLKGGNGSHGQLGLDFSVCSCVFKDTGGRVGTRARSRSLCLLSATVFVSQPRRDEPSLRGPGGSVS